MAPTVTVHSLPAYDPPLEPSDSPSRQLEFALPLQRRMPAAAATDEPPAGPLPPGTPTLEEAAAQAGAHAVLRLIMEVLDGRRPAVHLERAVGRGVGEYVHAVAGGLRALQQAGRRPVPPPAKIRTLHLQQPCQGVAEVSAVWQRGGRIAALAARFEQAEDARPLGWRCTALRLG